jgi:hypothetical protein
MAGVAGCFLSFAFKGYIERLMRIFMAAQAILQFKMCFSFMTFCTLRNHGAFYRSRRMSAVMAVETGHFRFVPVTGFLHLLNNGGMTFNTIIYHELGVILAKGLSGLDAPDEQ